MNTGAPVIVIGAGGHAVVVADALLAMGRQVLGFVDNDTSLHGQRVMGLTVLGDDTALGAYSGQGVELANGVGGPGTLASVANGTARQRVQQRLQDQGWVFATVQHPGAIVSAAARVGSGAQVLAGAVVQPAATVGCGAIVNTRAVVEHHASVGDFAHIAPGAVLCGSVQVGAESHVGAGAVVRQGVRLSPRVVVAMGAAVARDVAAGLVGGVPARALEASTRTET